MPARIRPLQRIIEHIGIPIEHLGITRPPRCAHLPPLLIAEGEPRPELVFAVHGGHKAVFMEVHRQQLIGDARHAASGVAGHHTVGVVRGGLRDPSRSPAGGRPAPPDHPASRAGDVCDAGGACLWATPAAAG